MSFSKRIALVAIVAGAFVPSIALAETYTVLVTPQNDRCYTINYHQQVDLVNTKGALVSAAGRSFSYNIVKQVGGTARDAYNPAIYIETRRTIAPEYYSLAPAGCP